MSDRYKGPANTNRTMNSRCLRPAVLDSQMALSSGQRFQTDLTPAFDHRERE